VDDGSNTLRSRWERTIRRGQDDVCAALERVDGCKFHEDTWLRDGGGGGITRVLQDGNVFEKAGVNVSVVYGTMPPDAYRAAVGEENVSKKEASVPFFAAGISSVVHPHNPMVPTMHFNYRYFETDPPPEVEGAPQAWWFGGGTDLTPSYLYDEDAKHFHQVYKDVCDRHDPEFYPRFKKWADDYYYIKCASLTQDISMTSLHTIPANRLGRLNVMNAGIAASDVVLEEYSSTTLTTAILRSSLRFLKITSAMWCRRTCPCLKSERMSLTQTSISSGSRSEEDDTLSSTWCTTAGQRLG
jgi:hypothetical protein